MKKKYGYAIVNSGEKAIVYNLEGEARLVDGPQRLFLWREKIEMLRRFTASQTEYLVVKYRNGKVEHINGIPTTHDTIAVRKAITIDAHEVVVVYRHNGEASERTVDRTLEYGPKMYIPASNEWLHKFCWHGIDPENKTRLIPGTNNFTKLKLIPEQFYYNVDEIRTSDNGLVRVKLMVFYEITDVNTMLGATDDPIGDIISCISADITAFTASRTYVDFVESSAKLNELSNYSHLVTMCKGSGIRVSKVVFRGYFAAPKIQASHDKALDKRTNLQLQFELEQQTQEMMDRELSAERDRLASSHKLETAKLKQAHKMDKIKQQHALELQLKEETDAITRKRADADAELAHTKSEMEQTLSHYSQLKSLSVDLNQYILNEAAIPERVTKIVTETPGGTALGSHPGVSPNFHFHMGSDSGRIV